VYYGQEIFLSGGNDPQNREALWDHGYGSNNLIKTLNKLRQLAISKDPKFITTQSKYLYNDDYQLYYQKGSLLVGLNGQGAQRKVAPYDQTIQGTTYTAGEVLIEVISCGSINAGSGQITVNIKDGAPIALYPKTSLVGSGICGL
jgi:alpha-amylase